MQLLNSDLPVATANLTRTSALSWFALRVRSNFESCSALHLQQRGYAAFWPTYKFKSRWSDRTKTTERPLFPGYLFCQVNPADRLPVLTVPGVVGLVGCGKKPVAIPDNEIDAVRTLVESGLQLSPWPFLHTGQRVLIERGPLANVEGILTEFKRGLRIVVSVNLLQRSVAAEMDGDWVRPIVAGPNTSTALPLNRAQ
jgi:transcription antitermination factor NusG